MNIFKEFRLFLKARKQKNQIKLMINGQKPMKFINNPEPHLVIMTGREIKDHCNSNPEWKSCIKLDENNSNINDICKYIDSIKEDYYKLSELGSYLNTIRKRLPLYQIRFIAEYYQDTINKFLIC